MTLLLRCKNQAYTDGEIEPRFIYDKTYIVDSTYADGSYTLTNELGEEHIVGGKDDKWFKKHFDIII